MKQEKPLSDTELLTCLLSIACYSREKQEVTNCLTAVRQLRKRVKDKLPRIS